MSSTQWGRVTTVWAEELVAGGRAADMAAVGSVLLWALLLPSIRVKPFTNCYSARDLVKQVCHKLRFGVFFRVLRRKWALKGLRQAELRFVQRQELRWIGKGGMDSKERRIRWKQRQVRVRARGSGIWQQQRRGRAGEHEGSAPASLRKRRVRAAGAGWGHSPRYWRLGGGGKQGWVT